MSSVQRDLADAFDDAGRPSGSVDPSVIIHGPTEVPRRPPGPAQIPATVKVLDPVEHLAACERKLANNMRSLESSTRRLASECDDRLKFIQKMRLALAEEERAVLQRRRCCDDLLGLGMKQDATLSSMRQHYARRLQQDDYESLADRERAIDERVAAVLRRVEEVQDLFVALDEKERATVEQSADLNRLDDDLDRQQRDAQHDAKELKVLEYDIEDRRRAVERRQDAIALWESRLDRREAELVRYEGAAAQAARGRVETIDLD
jgi:low affinity Fe/Cu permease